VETTYLIILRNETGSLCTYSEEILLINLDLLLDQVQILTNRLQAGFMYLSNMLNKGLEDVVTSSGSIKNSHNLITSPTRQLFVDLINQLDKIRSIYHQKYLKEYLESVIDKIMQNIQVCDKILIESSIMILRAEFQRLIERKNCDEIV